MEFARILPASMALAISGCGSDISKPEQFRWSAEFDPNLKPVTDRKAPTLRRLIDEGYYIVDSHEVGFSCGPGCTGDGFNAVYLGAQNHPEDSSNLANFVCPGTNKHSDTWKCRALVPPYVPNGGQRIEVGRN